MSAEAPTPERPRRRADETMEQYLERVKGDSREAPSEEQKESALEKATVLAEALDVYMSARDAMKMGAPLSHITEARDVLVQTIAEVLLS